MRTEEPRTCGDCIYCKEAAQEFHVCVFDAFQADTFSELSVADVNTIDPERVACCYFKHYDEY